MTWFSGWKKWIYAQTIATGLLFDQACTDETVQVDRMTAEAMTSEFLPSSLPSVRTQREMITKGARMGRGHRPPVSPGR